MYYHSNLTLHIQDRLDCGVRRSSRGGATWWHHPPPVQQGVHGQLCQTRPSLWGKCTATTQLHKNIHF